MGEELLAKSMDMGEEDTFGVPSCLAGRVVSEWHGYG
jgi:hypothetical protein